MTKIASIHIELTPVMFIINNGPDHAELRVTIKTSDGKQAGYSQIIKNDDLGSRFDWMWEHAGKLLAKHFKEISD